MGSASDQQLKFLIYGRTGWIGGLLGRICEAQSIPYEYGAGRLESRDQVSADVERAAPTHVFNAAGVTGRPNVDWCESHRAETIRANVVGTLTLADVCRERGLPLINYATGCIFEYDESHPLGSGVGFKEEDTPNFVGSFYSKTKAMIMELMMDGVGRLKIWCIVRQLRILENEIPSHKHYPLTHNMEAVRKDMDAQGINEAILADRSEWMMWFRST